MLLNIADVQMIMYAIASRWLLAINSNEIETMGRLDLAVYVLVTLQRSLHILPRSWTMLVFDLWSSQS